jgi:hypothetical protein
METGITAVRTADANEILPCLDEHGTDFIHSTVGVGCEKEGGGLPESLFHQETKCHAGLPCAWRSYQQIAVLCLFGL